MGRLIIVSNRVPSLRERFQPAGGLAVGLRDAVRGHETLWFGWSGSCAERAEGEDPVATFDVVDNVTFATIDLTNAEHEGFYQNFSNRILWPLCHYRAGQLTYARADWQMYVHVNALFARVLEPLLRPGDVIWVQDYHLFLLGQALRDLGVGGQIGFFLHIPFPPWGLLRALPAANLLLRSLCAYDLIGVQTCEDFDNLRGCLGVAGLRVETGVFAIGIDPQEFRQQAIANVSGDEACRLKDSLHGRALVLGVDRLDPSKGLPERLRGYERFLERYPKYRERVTFLQIAPVSRGNIAEYRTLRAKLDEMVGRINGEHATSDWTPLRYITRPVPRDVLAGFHRLAQVALVTPLRDGMNLVAKEFVAAQDEADPGVLVLSRFAGAAPSLSDALLVNPFDPDEIAEALDTALEMGLAERQTRWLALDHEVYARTAATWARDFLSALETAFRHRAINQYCREPVID